ncbi:hypothetical protein NX722_12345 [Endozoicomonas gorgoniicola]|uniref:Fork-head domain-containing protein n=1 Tax=Endozoicomonas gorgoniicola TaxID=1234144 RepID=A0ABT3MWQ4_9GAMM|nr:hypothetical protein [Endozoicomonas gorgoniicola]MCW7553409.1 hypothetical protein [Endozoicomonas gorgoniicola]
MDENKDSRLRIHPSAKLNNITVLSPPTDFDPHRGCMDTRIIFQANAEPFVVGISESASGHLCHTYHPSSGIISYGKTSASTTTRQNSYNSGGGGVAWSSYTNAHHTASFWRGGSSSGGGAGGDDRNPWRDKTMAECLADIILASEEQRLKLNEIYRRYHELLQVSDYDKKSKKNSIRHTLSSLRCFQRQEDTSGHGGFWSYDPSLRKPTRSRKLKRQEQQPAVYSPFISLQYIFPRGFTPPPPPFTLRQPFSQLIPPLIRDSTSENLSPHLQTETPPFPDRDPGSEERSAYALQGYFRHGQYH